MSTYFRAHVNKGYLHGLSARPAMYEVATKHCTFTDLGTGASFCHNYGLTTYAYYCYYDLGLRHISGAGCRKLQPNLAPMPYILGPAMKVSYDAAMLWLLQVRVGLKSNTEGTLQLLQQE